MTQGVLPFKYQGEDRRGGMTGLGGLPVYMEAIHQIGLKGWIEKHVGVRGAQGWQDWQMVTTIMLLNLAGGESVDDLNILSEDDGFGRILNRAGMHGLGRRERREMERRFRKSTERDVPSPSSMRRYLNAFHNENEEEKREVGRAFIPEAKEALSGLRKVNKEMMAFVQAMWPEETATLDSDATLVQTEKREALYSYKHMKSYQPFNVYWAEQGLVANTEFRDGNVPAGYEQLRVLKETLEMLPDGVKKVRMRSDTAGYQADLLKYCELGKNKRFGKIEFAVGCDVTPAFKKAVLSVPDKEWKPLSENEEDQAKREWAEVCFVPNSLGTSKKGTYRFLATREALAQPALPGLEGQMKLPFQTLSMSKTTYKIFGIVTNMKWKGAKLIHWLYERCGKSEEVHAIMKDDLAGGRLPSCRFGANAAWWWMMVLSLNLNEIMKRRILGGSWATKRMKSLRFHLINIPARVIEHSRQLIVKLSESHPSLPILIEARQAIASLSPGPPG